MAILANDSITKLVVQILLAKHQQHNISVFCQMHNSVLCWHQYNINNWLARFQVA